MTGEWKPAEEVVKRRLVARGEKTMAMEVHLAPGARGNMHQHPHEQLSRLLKGRMTFFIGHEQKELKAGDVIIIPGNVEHGVLAHEESLLLDVFSPPRQDLLELL